MKCPECGEELTEDQMVHPLSLPDPWISVEEKLPSMTRLVFACSIRSGPVLAAFHPQSERWHAQPFVRAWHWAENDKVTHWMELWHWRELWAESSQRLLFPHGCNL